MTPVSSFIVLEKERSIAFCSIRWLMAVSICVAEPSLIESGGGIALSLEPDG